MDYGFLSGIAWGKLSADGFAIALIGKDGVFGTAYWRGKKVVFVSVGSNLFVKVYMLRV